MRILVLNGPNLNLLESREASHYGGQSLAEIEEHLKHRFPDHTFEWMQSNHEGALIDAIQSAEAQHVDAIVANFGGYTHSSVAIHDALELVKLPKIEVHLSNLAKREEMRHVSVVGAAMDGSIAGFGALSYVLGVEAAIALALERGLSGESGA